MGVDIILRVEYKDNNGKWLEAPYEAEICYYCDGTKKIYRDNSDDGFYKCRHCNEDGLANVFNYIHRYYPIFQILGGWGRGELAKKLQPISEERGFPEDTSESNKEIQKYYENDIYKENPLWFSHGVGGFSYHTLSHLKEYDWDAAEKVCKGIKTEKFYARIIASLERLAEKYGGSDNVRILFHFDS